MAQVIRGMLANHVDHRYLSPAGVVEICQAIAEARAEMQKSARWFPGHPRVTVGRAGDDSLKKTQNAAHVRDLVKRGDQMNFRRAGVGEAGVDAARGQGANQIFGSIHRYTALSLEYFLPANILLPKNVPLNDLHFLPAGGGCT